MPIPDQAQGNPQGNPQGGPPADIPAPQIKRQGNGFRAYTENGCVWGKTRAEAMQKHNARMENRVKKGWPLKGRRKVNG